MDDLVGKSVKTEFGTAIVKRYIRSLKCWKIVYPDKSIGWVNESQFSLID